MLHQQQNSSSSTQQVVLANVLANAAPGCGCWLLQQ
jgi:hypothetical protein